MTTVEWQAYKEPLRSTLMRTVTIAVAVGPILAWRAGGVAYWPAAILMVLWPSFGGHWVEVWFLNWLRPRIPATRGVQIVARFVVWFAAGVIFLFCMAATAEALGHHRAHWPIWWLGGIGFIVVELMAHLFLLLRRRPSFYDARE